MPSCQIAFSSACKVAVAASGPAHQRLAHVVHHVAAPIHPCELSMCGCAAHLACAFY